MICPKCLKEMESGIINPFDYRSSIYWGSDAKKKGRLGIKVPVIKIVLGLEENGVIGKVTSYFCPQCMFLITPIADQSKVSVKTDNRDNRLIDEVIEEAKDTVEELEEKQKEEKQDDYFTDDDL